MSNYKILVKVTGSIAAYKSAYLISKLVQSGCEVKVVASEYALKFVGAATFEGLTGNQVFSDSFAQNSVMSHINLVKWADLTIVCPATANTINKLANGISDTLLTSLFLARDWKKPYLIAPAMNCNMYEHPATQESLKKLAGWGIIVLPTAEGYLACGDIGKGKLLEPDDIYKIIFETLGEKKHLKNRKKILITSGGTKESIDGVRYLANISTGKTASSIAEYFTITGNEVTLLHAVDTALPTVNCEKISFSSFIDLNEKLNNILSEKTFDVVIHLAAVSDYTPQVMTTKNGLINLPAKHKLNSEDDSISITLKRNFKIVERLKAYSKNKNICIIGFKLTSGSSSDEQLAAVKKILSCGEIDFIVANDLNDRIENRVQTNFRIYSRYINWTECMTVQDLSEELEKIIVEFK